MAVMKPLRVREKFIDALCRNIKGLSLTDEEQESLTAIAIKAFDSAPNQRQQFSCMALDILEQILPPPKKLPLQSQHKKGE